jgi:hypothetical protein
MGCARPTRKKWWDKRELSRVFPFFVRCPAQLSIPLPTLPSPSHQHHHLPHPAFYDIYPEFFAVHSYRGCNMSSPAKRSTRSSATPGRATRSSQQPSSPAAGPSNAAERTPRQTRSSQLASSPLFYQSSSPAPGVRASSPLRQMSNSQSTQHAPSSPLRQQTETQSAGDRTPRARNPLIGGEMPSFTPHKLAIDWPCRLVPHPL